MKYKMNNEIELIFDEFKFQKFKKYTNLKIL